MKSSASEPGPSINESMEDVWAPTIFFGQSEVCPNPKHIFVLLYFKLLSRPSVKNYFIINFKHFYYNFHTSMIEHRNVSVLICHFPLP